ncbi:hypothetical protein [Streptosporangium sp. KLBMP 9127]|nr:hypothetical protein [Streptosporangium sp. KLBMP 9127]
MSQRIGLGVGRVRRVTARLAHRIGRRGASLLFVALVSTVVALSLMSPPREVLATAGYLVLDAILPLRVWAAIWLLTAVLCVGQAFVRSDRIAFACASAMMVAWSLIYIVGAFTGVNPRGWVLGGVWLAFGAWLTLISTWAEDVARPSHTISSPDMDTNLEA